ncbi:MAG: hypothetical protein JNM10_17275 [Planctomycetia bacterium]|nr:hypothetical protein [Planctomycetia bacterium]
MPALLLLAAWISGTAALVAETIWFRALGRGVGTSAEALAVVSASFLGGLGLGAAVASRRAPTAKAPLRAAAVCEGIAGLLVALSPFALAIVPDAHLALLSLLGAAPGPSAWPAALVALPILVVPTAFLGATLPLLVRGRLRALSNAGRWTGLLYGVNTFGAACGTVGGLVLLDRLGERGALALAGAGNLLAALALLAADAAAGRAAAAAPTAEPLDRPPLAPPAGRPAVAPLVALFVTGALALAAEVVWFRLLDPITGVHVFGFAVLLVGVLVGTALGGLFGGVLADRVRRPDLVLAVVVTLAGVATTASVLAAGATPAHALVDASEVAAAMKQAATDAGQAAPTWDALTAATNRAIFAARVRGALWTVVPPLFLFAVAYPLAVRARARSVAGAAGAAGTVYAWNTLGNVVGSLLAGFLLLPTLGTSTTLLLLGGVGVMAGVALWIAAAGPRPVWVAAVLALPLAPASLPGAVQAVEDASPTLPEIVLLGRWTPELPVRDRADVRLLAETVAGTYPTPAGRPDAPPVRPRDGVMSTVGLLLERGAVKLRQGGLAESKIVPSDPDAGTETEVALALVPYLLHPRAETALAIGHGAGWTVETLLSTDLERVDVAEIEPAVLDVVQAYRPGPLAVRTDPKARLHLTDGRILLRQAAARGGAYDLVVSQPSHPWVPGAGHLFTRDAYRLARAALRPGGVFAQWLNIFNMTEPLFRTALASWQDVFPHGWVLLYNDEVLLVGCLEAPVVHPVRWRKALDQDAVGVRARAAGITGVEDVLRRLVLDGPGLAKVLGPDAVPSTDDDPRLELGLAKTMFFGESTWSERNAEKAAIYAALASAYPPDFAAILPNAPVRDAVLAATAQRAVEAGGTAEAWRLTRKAPFDGGALGQRVRARARFAEARLSDKKPEEARQLRNDGLALLDAAARASPDDVSLLAERLAALVDHGDAARAVAEGAALVARFPDHGPIRAHHARALMSAGDETAALDAFRAAVAARSPRAPAGTAWQLARLLLVAEPPLALEARDALRATPELPVDRAALRKLRELEIETAPPSVEEPPEVTRVEKLLREADAVWGAERLEVARREVDDNRQRGFDAARDATLGLPTSAEAWRLKGWYELRLKRPDDAVKSLTRAVRHADDPVAMRRTAEGYLALFGHRDLKLPEDAP